MTPELRRRLSLAIECIPNANRRQEFIRGLREQFPQETGEIDSYLACSQRGQDPRRCLNRVVYGQHPPSGADAFISLSSSGHSTCVTITGAGESTRTLVNFVPFSHAASDTILGDAYRTGLTTAERDLLDGLVLFYANRRGPAIADLRMALRSRPEWARRLDRYPASNPTATLNPMPCPNATDFERHDVIVSGLPFRIPAYRTQDSHYPWIFLESDIQVAFEILKVFLAPRDFEGIFRPGVGRPEMGIYLSGPFSAAVFSRALFTYDESLFRDASLERCGMVDTGRYAGEFTFSRNLIWVRSMQGGQQTEFENRRPELTHVTLPAGQQFISSEQYSTTNDFTWDAIFHEVSHAVAFNLLRSLSNSTTWQNIVRFYDWSRQQAGTAEDRRVNSNRAKWIPNYTSTTISAGNVSGMSLDGESRNYALTNADEFFAELCTEYIKFELGNLRPASDAYRARRRIMESFFAEGGIHMAAFDPANIEAAFRAEGISMILPPAVWHEASD